MRTDKTNQFHFEEGEILNFDKPINMSSFRLVSKVRGITGCKKVGHAGTLDPLASGVLLVCTGKSTKRVSELMDFEKVYEGEIELGKQTETDDAEGKVIASAEVPELPLNLIESGLQLFRGDIEQIPPVYSAIRIQGKRAYKLARQGKAVAPPVRQVTVFDLTILCWQSPILKIRIRCSKGTYIRSLARDIGNHLGTYGYLKNLRRISIGPYHVDNALQLEDFKKLVIGHENLSIA